MFSHTLTKNILNTFVYQILSKGLGYIKYLIFAVAFGMSYEMDAYSMALTVLDVSMFVIGHVFTVVGVPQLVKAKKKSLLSFKRLSGSIFTFALVLTIVLVPLQYIYFDSIISFLAPGFDAQKIERSYDIFNYFIGMSVIYLPFFALLSFFRALNLFNISNLIEFIVSLLSFSFLIIMSKTDVSVIPLSLSIGYVIAILFSLYFARKIKIIGFYGSLFRKELKEIYINAFKLSLWFLVLQFIRVVDKGFASLLENGMIIALMYSSMILSGIGFIFNFATVYLTKFSEGVNKGLLFTKAIKLYITISIPIIVFLIFYSHDLIKLIYGYGAFDNTAVLVTSQLVSLFSPLLFLGLVNSLFQSLYQSLNKYSYMIFLSFVGVVLNFILNSYLIDDYKIYGIAIATSFSTTVIFFINIYFIRYKEGININYLELIKYFSKIFIITSLSYIVTLIVSDFIFNVFIFFMSYFILLYFIRDEFFMRVINEIKGKLNV